MFIIYVQMDATRQSSSSLRDVISPVNFVVLLAGLKGTSEIDFCGKFLFFIF